MGVVLTWHRRSVSGGPCGDAQRRPPRPAVPRRATVRGAGRRHPGAAAHFQLAAQLAVYSPARLYEMFSALVKAHEKRTKTRCA